MLVYLQRMLYAKEVVILCAMMVQVAGYSKLIVCIYQTKRHHISEDI